MLAYKHRNAGAVIHTHSPNAVMATLLWPGKEFRCTHLEMIKVKKIKFIFIYFLDLLIEHSLGNL